VLWSAGKQPEEAQAEASRPQRLSELHAVAFQPIRRLGGSRLKRQEAEKALSSTNYLSHASIFGATVPLTWHLDSRFYRAGRRGSIQKSSYVEELIYFLSVGRTDGTPDEGPEPHWSVATPPVLLPALLRAARYGGPAPQSLGVEGSFPPRCRPRETCPPQKRGSGDPRSPLAGSSRNPLDKGLKPPCGIPIPRVSWITAANRRLTGEMARSHRRGGSFQVSPRVSTSCSSQR
jgi:hypothetical protein